MSLQKEIVRIAEGEVGTREAERNNTGAEIVRYQEATWLKPDAWPWCAAFTCWVLQEALKTSPGQGYLVRNNLSVEGFRCKDASAFGWVKWANKHGLTVFDEHSKVFRPQAGDFVVFDFSHIGIVVQDSLPGEKHIHTVEGNTNGKGDRDSENGDGVWSKWRAVNLVKSYIRL